MKKVISFVLTAIMIISMLPISVLAAGMNETKITVDSTDAVPGERFSIDVNLENNPGIISASISVAFDDGLTLVGASNGDTFPRSMLFIPPKQLSTTESSKTVNITSSCTFAWSGIDIDDADIKDGTILTLDFMVSENAEIGTVYHINVTSRNSDIIDKDLNSIAIAPAQGKVTVIDYTPGDVDDNGLITMRDTTLISRYIVDGCMYDPDGYAVRLNEKAADVNDDGSITMHDTVLINRYIVDGCKTDPNGYNITLKSGSKRCSHSMTAFEAKEASCVEDGNIAYWYCENCKKYFADINGARIITLAETVITAQGHNVIVDPAVPATETSVGWTEGSHCDICKTVLVEQEEIPTLKVNSYNIIYHLWDNETDYLKAIELDNSKNPTTRACSKSLRLQPIETENDIGFDFLYWYQKGDDRATTVIEANTMEDGDTIHLYAKWKKIEYTVQFETNLVPVDDTTYTIDKEKSLPSESVAHVDGYIFAGWSDDNGDIITRIPKGTTGDKVYTANYVSERNQAWTKNRLDDPIIIEDEETNTILFTYEIGEIRNVPLYVINDFGKINASGISQTVTKTFSTTISESLMNNYTNTVANAVTDSYGVTLSNGWSDSTSMDESWAKEHGMTTEEAEQYCKSDTSGWYVSSGSSGSKSVTTVSSSQNYDLSTSTNSRFANADVHESKYDNNELHVDSSIGANLGINLGSTLTKNNKKSTKTETNGNSAGISGNISAGGSTAWGSSSSTNAYAEILDASSSQRGSITSTGTNSNSSSSWHNESGKNASSTVSNSSSVSKAVSEKVSEVYGYGKSYVINGSESSNQAKTSSQTNSDQYSNTVTYSKATNETETVTYTTTNTSSGYHRWIMAGTAHVFAIVGYDIASKSYFITTYSVMDDEMHKFEDYSYSTAAYNDNQNGQISFEIPVEVNDYVAERVCETEGLEISKTGIITNYRGAADYVIIPEYKVIENLDGTTQVIKVVGISETAFQGNKDIFAVELSENISSIPDNAFKNCTSLLYVYGTDIVSIGNSAFSGCTSLEYAIIDDTVEVIGTKAFDCVKAFAVNAANESIVDAAVNSGAKNIVVYISDKCGSLDNKTVSIVNTTESFTFNGMGKAYTDLVIDSNATERTAVYRTNITSSKGTPVKVNSKVLELDECSFTAPGMVMKVVYDMCKVKLYGESTLNSASGKALLCKNILMGQIKDDFESKLTVNGDVLICGHVTTEGKSYSAVVHSIHNNCDDTDYVKCTGKFNHINEEEFNKYVVGYFKVNFNANGGSVDTSVITAQYGSALGELPKPTRTNYVFDGWYTAETGGELVTSATVFGDVKDITLNAHWTLNTYTLSFNANGGFVSENSRVATCNTEIGTLPMPIRDYYTFDGWYTSASGGTRVSSSSVFNSATVLYAHWTINGVSDWVDVSDVPDDAQVVNRKYIYTLREYTTDVAPSLTEWTRYDAKITSYSSETGPVYTDPSGNDRKVRSERYVTSSNYKTVYHYYYYSTGPTDGNTSYYATSTYGKVRSTVSFYSALPTAGVVSGHTKYKWSNHHGTGKYMYVYEDDPYTTQEKESDNYGTRWYYQDPIYTYYYYRDLSQEASSNPSGQSNVSNIKELVQYRTK